MKTVLVAEPFRLESRMYRPSEVSRFLGVPKASVYGWIKDKHVSATKIGGRYFVAPSELARILGCDRSGGDAAE